MADGQIRISGARVGRDGKRGGLSTAKRGRRVLASTVHPATSIGISHGETRITRIAIGEGRTFTHGLRSQELWREIEKEKDADSIDQSPAGHYHLSIAPGPRC